MEKRPLVSILIPSYNHELYVDDLMKSLLGQTYDEMEILIIDDCSTDRNYQKLLDWKEQLENKFQTVHISRNDVNLGVTKTLNKMLQMCNGKYIKPIASDDFILTDGIDKLVKYYEEHQEYGAVFANGVCGDRNTHYPIENVSAKHCYYHEEPDLSGDLASRIYKNSFIFTPGSMFIKDTFAKIGQFDEETCIEDWDYFFRIAKEMPIGYLDDIVVMYRYTNTSITQSCCLENRIKMRRSELQFLDKFKAEVSESLSRECITMKCNEIYKEAFDMRSKKYVEEIYAYMKKNRIRFRGTNQIYRIVYQMHLVNRYFS